MYRDTIRCGAHKCLVSERQETVLRPWEGMTLFFSWEKDEKEEDGETAELSYHAQTVRVCIS